MACTGKLSQIAGSALGNIGASRGNRDVVDAADRLVDVGQFMGIVSDQRDRKRNF